jgi:hypothetical protein
MRGFIVRNGRETVFDTGTTRVVSRRGCCRSQDLFRIEGLVTGHEFNFDVSLQNPDSDDEGEPFTARFIDRNKSFQYGNVGLTAADDRSETAVEVWLVIARQR